MPIQQHPFSRSQKLVSILNYNLINLWSIHAYSLNVQIKIDILKILLAKTVFLIFKMIVSIGISD